MSLGAACQLAHNASQQAQLLHKNDIISQHHLAHSALPQQGHTRDQEEKAAGLIINMIAGHITNISV